MNHFNPKTKFPFARVLTTCAWLSLLLIGCKNSKNSLYEEIDHETPAHWPADMVDASNKIQSRLQTLASQPDDSVAKAEIIDLINWCAEVAADTNLNEEQWQPIYEQSEVCRKQVHAGVAVSSLTSELQQLCSTLEAAHKALPIQPNP